MGTVLMIGELDKNVTLVALPIPSS